MTALSFNAGLSLRWLQPVVASGLMLVGVLFMTACPAEAGVARWGIGILALSALASLWPVVVYAADLSFGALSGPIGNSGTGILAIEVALFAGMLAALCRWMAQVERRRAASFVSALSAAETSIEVDQAAVWETLAGRWKRLFHGATTFLIVLLFCRAPRVALQSCPLSPADAPAVPRDRRRRSDRQQRRATSGSGIGLGSTR